MIPALSIQFRSTVRLGLKSLLLHKLRSVLTMLGIIFGVCSVIAMLAIGEGASYEAQEAIKNLGRDNIILRSIKPPEDTQANGGGRGSMMDYGLTYQDAARIQATVLGVLRVLPVRIIRENVRFSANSVPCQVLGTLPVYTEIAGLDVLRGRFLSHLDVENHDNVCVLTAGLAERLFPYQDPLTQAVKIDSFYYRVVGLVREKSAVAQRTQSGRMEGEPLDNNVYIPLSTARSRFGEVLVRRSAGSFEMEKVELHQITVQMRDLEAVEAADAQIKTLLGRFHNRNDYEVIVPLQLLRQAEQTKRLFNVVLGSIAAISLLVGGIGIMNIMLASVGILVPLLVSHVTTMKTVITPWSVLLAFGISGAVGIIFGLYPAKAAARLDPIEALRRD
jgi:putative ABC transport system permease protein